MIARLKQLDAHWIGGNVDRWLVDDSNVLDVMKPLIARSRELLGDDLARELPALPESTTHGCTLYCHASPLSDMDGFYPEPHETDAERLMGMEAERVLMGHTHLQFKQTGPGGIELVNPGSVGIPLDRDRRAAYAVLRDDGEIETPARRVRLAVGATTCSAGVPLVRRRQRRHSGLELVRGDVAVATGWPPRGLEQLVHDPLAAQRAGGGRTRGPVESVLEHPGDRRGCTQGWRTAPRPLRDRLP